MVAPFLANRSEYFWPGVQDNAHYSAPVSAALARRIWEAAGAGAPAAQRISSSTLNSVANRY